MARGSTFVLLALLLTDSTVLAQQDDVKTIEYGSHPTNFGELRLPLGDGPFPVVAMIHGGCWRSDRGSVNGYRSMARDLERIGIASWNIEYRRVGHEGGGWPGTFLDLGLALDHLEEIAKNYSINLSRVVVLGHSSGGHLAAWLATRRLLPETSEIRGQPNVTVAGVAISDAIIDPRVSDSVGENGELACGVPILATLIDGSPESRSDRLHQISPVEWLPWGIPQEYVVSSDFYPVRPDRTYFGGRVSMQIDDYPALALAAGDLVSVNLVDDAAHLDFYNPGTEAYETVLAAVLRIVEQTAKANVQHQD